MGTFLSIFFGKPGFRFLEYPLLFSKDNYFNNLKLFLITAHRGGGKGFK